MKLLESIIKSDCLWEFTTILEETDFYYCHYHLNFFKFECLRRWNNDLKSSFEMLLDDFYSMENGSCPTILLNHFGEEEEKIPKKEPLSKNFKSYLNRNLLLTFLWQYKDINSWKKCHDSSGILDSYSNTQEEMDDYRWRKDQILTLFFSEFNIFNIESNLMLVLRNNHKISFHFLDSNTLYFIELLRMLKIIGPFTWKNLLDIIDFDTCEKNQSH